jgi:hypothetical protein
LFEAATAVESSVSGQIKMSGRRPNPGAKPGEMKPSPREETKRSQASKPGNSSTRRSNAGKEETDNV